MSSLQSLRELIAEREERMKMDDENAAPLRKYRSQESVADDPFSTFDSILSSSGILQPERQGLLKDIVQTQLALWTFTFSIVYTYCWQKRVQPKSFVVALAAINLAMCLSGLLALLVIGAHVFNRDLHSMWYAGGHGSDSLETPPKRQRGTSISSVCSGGGGALYTSRPNSGASTPLLANKGHASFWQRKISTERVYFGNTIRS